MATKKTTKTTGTGTKAPAKASGETSGSGFSAAERAAMKARAAEVRNEGRGGAKKAKEAEACLAAIAEMPDADRVLAERIHALVAEHAPGLDAKTWYGMPAYARDGKVVCFFQSAAKFDARYATFGFNDTAALDDGNLWPTSFAVTQLTKADEKQLAALIAQAVA